MPESLISFNDFILRMSKVINISSQKTEEIKQDWPTIARVASEILVEFPSIGIWNKRKRIAAYKNVSDELHKRLNQKSINIRQHNFIELLLDFSSKRYVKASKAFYDEKASISYRDVLIHLPIGIAIVLFFSAFVESRTGEVSSTYQYYTSDINETTEGIITQSKLRINENAIRGYIIRYAYEVNGVTHENDTVNYKSNYASVGREYVNKYPIGKKVVVNYDAKNPDVSVIEISKPDLRILLELFGILFMGAMYLYSFIIAE